MPVTLLESSPKHPCYVEASLSENSDLEAALAWHENNRDLIENKLLSHGAVLFKGFSINSSQALKKYAQSIFGSSNGYVDGNSPRTLVDSGVYTSTEYPPEQIITLHNELSYSHSWPEKLMLCCCTPPLSGGETPITDGRKLLGKIDDAILSVLIERKVMYVRNLHNGQGLGPSWQDTFETEDRQIVESYLRQDPDCEFKWNSDSSLQIKQIRSPIAQHPVSGEWVWFNQVDQFHLSSLGEAYYQALKSLYSGKEDELPINACFGDETPIPEEWIDTIRETCLQESIRFPWQEGDLLIIDNMLMMHGRMPFEGNRKILVSIVGCHRHRQPS